MAIEIFGMTIRLNYHVSILKKLGVAANRPHPLSDIAPGAPLVKMFRNHPCGAYPQFADKQNQFADK